MKKKKGTNRGLIFIGLGIEMMALVLGALFLGEKLDETYEFGRGGTLGILLAVLIGWFYHLIILMKRFMDEDEAEAQKDPQ